MLMDFKQALCQVGSDGLWAGFVMRFVANPTTL